MLSNITTSAVGGPSLPSKFLTQQRHNTVVKDPTFQECYQVLKDKYTDFKTGNKDLSGEWKDFFVAFTKKETFDPLASLAPHLDKANHLQEIHTNPEKFRSLMHIILRAFQIRGHLVAKTDPLDLPKGADNKGQLWYREDNTEWNPDQIVKTLGLTEKDLDAELPFDPSELNPHHRGFLSGSFKGKTLRDFIDRLSQVYCSSIGHEFIHIQDPQKLMWLMERIELSTPCYNLNTKDTKKHLLKKLIEAQSFEDILQKKFPTTKRFGLDGCESMVPLLQEICNHGESDTFVLGMAHRGRLNVLSNVFGKPTVDLFREFKGIMGFGGSSYGNTGDVKYHLGVFHERHHQFDKSRKQRFSLLCNPSHLEAVDPVVLGKSKAMQDRLVTEKGISIDEARKEVLPIIIHGDSSIAGQGVVFETAQMQNLAPYDVGGTVHIVSNNQIGFTTTPGQYLSSRYCTDGMKGFDVPVFHVNSDDIEAVRFIAQLAIDYRNTFQSDVVIDVVGYRRNGHNEQDMPSFTNPRMYKYIANQPRSSSIYAAKLIDEGVVTEEEVEEIRKEVLDKFETALKEATVTTAPDRSSYTIEEQWKSMHDPTQFSAPRITGLPMESLRTLGKELFAIPEGFTAHPTIKKIYDARAQALKNGKNIDFGTAEALAFGSLLSEGTHVRVCGQDSQRGTFSHRHAVLHDNISFEQWSPLATLTKNTPRFQIYNSHLSEYAALGFEYGYASQHPDNLTIWEAQFGDFANGAQIMIDTFICSGEVKWGQQNGLIMYLPHGYDGMGPEHSSCRIERYLMLCDNREDIIDPVNFDREKRRIVQTSNMQIIMPTTPSNLFHAIRRQVHRGFRKPLIVAQSKKLLKMRQAQSSLQEIEEGTRFVTFYGDNQVKDIDSVERLILCSGQVYYDLIAQRKKNGGDKTKTAIARIEQLCPLPYSYILDEIHRYPNLKSLVWCQEEPMNAGMWNYMNPRLQTCLMYSRSPIVSPIYVGRDVCASTATGCPKIHAAELDKFLTDAFDLTLNHHSSKAYFVVASDGVTMQETHQNPAYYLHPDNKQHLSYN